MQTQADLTSGHQFGRLTTTGKTERRRQHLYAECWCECSPNTLRYFRVSRLRDGKVKSCGCLRRDTKPSQSHGLSKTRAYSIWTRMKQRCGNPKDPDYSRYGGSGVTVCEHWMASFEAFYADMGDPPSEQHTLDRRDGALGYSPENCRWATLVEQNNNKRTNVMIEWNGRVQTATQWARELGLNPITVRCRLRKGWPPARAFDQEE